MLLGDRDKEQLIAVGERLRESEQKLQTEQKQPSAILLTQLEMVAVLLNAVRADIVPEIVALAHHIPCIKVEVSFLASAIEVMEDTQPVRSGQLHTLGTQGGKV